MYIQENFDVLDTSENAIGKLCVFYNMLLNSITYACTVLVEVDIYVCFQSLRK